MDQPLIPVELYNPALLLADPRSRPPHPLLHRARRAVRLADRGCYRGLGAGPAPGSWPSPALASAPAVLWLGGRGQRGRAVLGACRLIGLPLFSRPLWLWFTLIALGVVVGYFLYYWRKRYPREYSVYEEAARRAPLDAHATQARRGAPPAGPGTDARHRTSPRRIPAGVFLLAARREASTGRRFRSRGGGGSRSRDPPTSSTARHEQA